MPEMDGLEILPTLWATPSGATNAIYLFYQERRTRDSQIHRAFDRADDYLAKPLIPVNSLPKLRLARTRSRIHSEMNCA
jgi:CheY-like chemotaxis protein